MSNFKLTDENKQTLIMALTFSDDKLVEQSRDALIQEIKDGKINNAGELTPYCYYVKASLDSHKAMLKHIIDDELVLGENVDNKREELLFCNRLLSTIDSNLPVGFSW